VKNQHTKGVSSLNNVILQTCEKFITEIAVKLCKTLILTLVILLAGTSILWAGEAAEKPLDEVFDRVLILPFDYHDKVFLNGIKTDVSGDYKLWLRDGRVLVPVRFMAYLVEKIDGGNSYWQVNWDQQKPEEVTLINHKLQKTVSLKVNSNIMYVNGEARTLAVPPQIIEGRILLPLRGIGEALEKKVAWLDGLILVSNETIDLQSPRTLALTDKIKAQLVDERKNIISEQLIIPLMKYGDTVYFIKEDYRSQNATAGLYKKEGKQPEVKIELPGEEQLYHRKVINNELYYVAEIDGKSELHIFSPADGKARKLCDLGPWSTGDGWLGDVKYINDELYVVLHYGDLTMGAEKIYRVENHQLTQVGHGKQITNYDAEGDNLYYTDFRFMSNAAGNLYKVNLQTGATENLGDQEYTYGVFRSIDNDGISYSGSVPFYVQDNFIFTLGYQESNQEDKPGVYKISAADGSHYKLAGPVRTFWLVDQAIYYIDLITGNLARVDWEGNNRETLVSRKVLDVKFHDGSIYYTASKDGNTNFPLGHLYKYSLADGRETKLSDKLVSEFYVGRAGVYYKAEGYDLGLYKIEADGRSICITDDSVDSVLMTDAGLVYTLRYESGVYTVPLS